MLLLSIRHTLRCMTVLLKSAEAPVVLSLTILLLVAATSYSYAHIPQSAKQSIHQAAANGDIAQVRRLLDANPGLINSSGDNLGNTPLHFATWNGRAAMAEYLISRGANVHAKNSMGNTPLHDAIHNSGLLVPIVLLQHGADIDERNNEEETPLIRAARIGHVGLLRLLLDKGAAVDAVRVNDSTALACALWDQHVEAARILLRGGADINFRGKKVGYTALHFAAESGRIEMIHFLLANGADMVLKSLDGSMPIHKAALNGRGDAVLALIA